MNSILFLLPVSGGSGGAHSVVQESDAMRRMGLETAIAVNHDNFAKFRKTYRGFSSLNGHIHPYQSNADFIEIVKRINPSVIVATTNQSVHFLDASIKLGKISNIRSAYYIQDYEPLFYEKGTDNWQIAYTSYGLIPNMIHFAKTKWLQEVVEDNHLIQVQKVEPSIDHEVYFPNLRRDFSADSKIRVAAMLRPATPRRAPRRTNRLIDRVAQEFRDKVEFTTFGCTLEDLKIHSLRVNSNKHLGVLSREDVAELFRSTDLFLDLSDFQAFGRTAIEAMSCGSISVVPAHGGAYEYAIDGVNSFIVDTRSDDAILAAVGQFLAMSEQERRAMTFEAIAAGYRYSPEKAALSEIKILVS